MDALLRVSAGNCVMLAGQAYKLDDYPSGQGILVVDDGTASQKEGDIHRAEHEGFRFFQAANGREALDRARSRLVVPTS
jgi:hypothetical protein